MTVVEFFDNTSIENIVSALLCKPEKVILIGDNGKRLKKHIALYEEIIHNRNLTVDFTYKAVNRNDLSNIINVLSDIVESHDDCIFDLDGGEDLYLVAVGYVYNQYRGRIQLHRFNIRNNTLTDCDSDGKLLQTAPMEISVSENIRIYAGKIITDFTNGFKWNFNEEFLSDLEVMWLICREKPSFWNQLGSALTALGEDCISDNTVVISQDTAGLSWKAKSEKLNYGLLKRLTRIGLLNDLVFNDEEISFSFKNEQIKKCITKAGQVLELYVTVTAKALKDKNGQPLYNDVQTGVMLDWDGFSAGTSPIDEAATINEIDVILMKGLVPVFISCKNGMVEVDELYKLSAVAERFGGKYAKKVLIVSDLDASNYNYKYICSRAEDMSIRLIDDVAELNEREFEKAVASLWCN